MILIKPGASIDGCRKEILQALIEKIAPIYEVYAKDCIVTSGTEHFKHTVKRSAHYRGDAIDLRTKHLSHPTKWVIFEKIRQTLGQDFVVVFESVGKPNEHFHIHWSPVFNDQHTEH